MAHLGQQQIPSFFVPSFQTNSCYSRDSRLRYGCFLVFVCLVLGFCFGHLEGGEGGEKWGEDDT